MASVEIGVGSEQLGVIGRHITVALAEPRNGVNRMRICVCESEVCRTKESGVGDPLVQAQLQAVIAGVADIAELIQVTEAAIRIARCRVEKSGRRAKDEGVRIRQ